MGPVAEVPTENRSPDEAALAEQAQAAGEPEAEHLDGEHPDEQAPPAVPPLQLEGKGKQLSLRITGDTPDKATAKIVGGKIDIPAGEYQPGEVVEVVARIRCTRVAVIDKMNNATGERTEREREHQFKLMQIERVDG